MCSGKNKHEAVEEVDGCQFKTDKCRSRCCDSIVDAHEVNRQ